MPVQQEKGKGIMSSEELPLPGELNGGGDEEGTALSNFGIVSNDNYYVTLPQDEPPNDTIDCMLNDFQVAFGDLADVVHPPLSSSAQANNISISAMWGPDFGAGPSGHATTIEDGRADDDLIILSENTQTQTTDHPATEPAAEEEPPEMSPNNRPKKTTRSRKLQARLHSLCEKRRRDRIKGKMEALKQLIPNGNSNRSEFESGLDDAIRFVADMNRQVEMMWVPSGTTSMLQLLLLQQHQAQSQFMAPPPGLFPPQLFNHPYPPANLNMRQNPGPGTGSTGAIPNPYPPLAATGNPQLLPRPPPPPPPPLPLPPPPPPPPQVQFPFIPSHLPNNNLLLPGVFSPPFGFPPTQLVPGYQIVTMPSTSTDRRQDQVPSTGQDCGPSVPPST